MEGLVCDDHVWVESRQNRLNWQGKFGGAERLFAVLLVLLNCLTGSTFPSPIVHVETEFNPHITKTFSPNSGGGGGGGGGETQVGGRKIPEPPPLSMKP